MNAKYQKWINFSLAGILIGILLFITCTQMRENHLQDDPMLYLLKDILQPLQPFFDKKYPEAGVNFEQLKLFKGEKSYTINKNHIFLCLYDENGEYYPVNMIVYVLLHEIAHKANTKDIGHTENFYLVFDEILDEANRLNIYNPSIPVVKNYCGGD